MKSPKAQRSVSMEISSNSLEEKDRVGQKDCSLLKSGGGSSLVQLERGAAPLGKHDRCLTRAGLSLLIHLDLHIPVDGGPGDAKT